MKLWGLAFRSVSHYRRSAAAVALGVVVGSAALTGSLLVGDSVKGSMLEMALERLGRTDYILVSRALFTEGLADRVAARDEAKQIVDSCAPAIIMPGTVRSGDSKTVVPGVTVIGVTPAFFEVAGRGRPGGGEAAPEMPSGRSVLVNATLARELGLGAGEAVLLSVGKRQPAPTNSIFARRSREDTLGSARLTIAGVIPASGVGGAGGAGAFKLTNDSSPARNIYVGLARLQKILGLPGKCNALLIAAKPGAGDGDPAAALAPLQEALAGAAGLEDYGLRLLAPHGDAKAFTLQGERFVLPGAAARAVASGLHGRLTVRRSSVHLANALRVAGRKPPDKGVPYSVVAAVEKMGEEPMGGFTVSAGKIKGLKEGEIVLNLWAARDLRASVDKDIELDYYASDGRGELTTQTLRLKLKGVVAMKGAALDESFVPSFEGITDADTMGE